MSKHCFFGDQIQSITDSSRGSIRRKNPSKQSTSEEPAGASLAEKPEEEVLKTPYSVHEASLCKAYTHYHTSSGYR